MGIFGFVLSIGQAFASACKVVVPEVIKVLKTAGATLDAFAKSVEFFFQELGIIPKDQSIDEIGNRALQAEQDDIKVEDFEDPNDFFKEIKDKYEVDPSISPEDSTRKGVEISTGCAIQKFGVDTIRNFESGLVAVNGNFDKNTVIDSILKSEKIIDFIKEAPNNFSLLTDFLQGKTANASLTDLIASVAKEVAPNKSISEILSDLNSLRSK